MRQNWNVRWELKEIDDKGKFAGIASIYGAVDLGGDVVERGAFAKTLSERPTVPILWHHDAREVIGSGKVHGTREGLRVEGELDIDVDQTAQKAHAKMKRGRVTGLSIGYESMRDEVKNGIRHLQEVKLWEISIVTFPMLPGAQVTSVKTAEDVADFLDRFAVEIGEMKTALANDAAARKQFLSLLGDAGLMPTSSAGADAMVQSADLSALADLITKRSDIRWN